MTVGEVAHRFQPAGFRWWLAGGHALELHLAERTGTVAWRRHDDIDIGICRQDAPRLFETLADWDLRIASSGVLYEWGGEPLKEDGRDRAGNNVWCRPGETEPWALDVLVGGGDRTHWIYRRDPAVRLPWQHAVLRSDDGLPYLAPEIQMLFKSRTIRPKDAHDAEVVIPRLSLDRKSWLADQLEADHPWQVLIERR